MTDRSPLALFVTNDEPRILDTDLAERLGVSPPRKVRQNIIEPNREELEGLVHFGWNASKLVDAPRRSST